MNATEFAVVVLAVSAPGWHLLAPRLGLQKRHVAAAALAFDLIATFALPSLVTPDWSWLRMLAIAVPSALASIVSFIVLHRLTKQAYLEWKRSV